MTFGDMQFLKKMGIDPPSLDDPLPSSLPPPPPPEATIPKLTEEDARWLKDLRVAWGHEVEPEFVVPKTLREYLALFPTGIREAVEAVAEELGLRLTDGSLENLTHEIKEMFIGFDEEGWEDVIAMYEAFPPIRPREDRSEHFQSYVEMRVRAALPVVLGNMGAEER